MRTILSNYFSTQQPALLETIRQYVEFETPSHDKTRLDGFADLLAERFADAGATITRFPQTEAGNHLRATLPLSGLSDVSAKETPPKPALVLCHFDTVWPVGTLDRMPFRIEDGKAYGPGIFDMKSSLVLIEFIIRFLQQAQPQTTGERLTMPRPLTVLMTSDEEVGSRTSRQLIEEEARRSEYVLVLESPLPGGVLKTSRKGIGGFRLGVTGKAAHAGVDPDKGVSAILELSQQIVKLYGLIDREKGTTLNVGVVQGGTAANVIAAEATAQIDVRTWTEDEAQRISQAMQGVQAIHPTCKLQVTGGWNRPPLERSATAALFARAQQVGESLGQRLQEGGTGGGSDGNFTGALGIPTLDGLGLPGAGAHADHEQIELDQIVSRAVLLAGLLLKL